MRDIPPAAIDAVSLRDIFPFHIAVDSDLNIVQFGRSLAKLTPGMSIGDPLLDHWKILRASLGDDWGSLVDSAGSLVVLESEETDIRLKGQVVAVDSGKIVMFLATPVLSSIEMMSKSGLELRDFAAHDVIVDFLFALQIRDRTLTEIHDAHRRLSEHSRNLEDYRSMIDRHVGWIVLDETGVILESNDAFSGIVSIEEKDLLGKKFSSLLCDESDAFEQGFKSVHTKDETWQGELHMGAGENGESWCFATMSRWKSARDGSLRFSLIFTDITARMEYERRQSMMMRELDHRVKNSLATVLSLCQATAVNVDSIDEYVERFSNRIAAMASTHEVLASSHWRATTLEDLIKITLAHMANGQGASLNVEGKSFLIGSQSATSMTLILHELGTNAVKYGSFSSPGGHLDISWTIEGDDIRLRWAESGGPKIQDRGTPGVGFSIVTGIVKHELRGQIEFEFEPSGLVATLVMSLSHMQRE